MKKLGNRTLSTLEEVDEIAYYKGSENPIVYSRDYYLRFQCHFELYDYPFDMQVCKIMMRKPDKVANFVRFVPTLLKYNGPKQMAEFLILKLDIMNCSGGEDCDIKVEIVLRRRISQHLLSTYLPSFCILCVAQVTIFHLNKLLDFKGCFSGDFILFQGTFQDCYSPCYYFNACYVHPQGLHHL